MGESPKLYYSAEPFASSTLSSLVMASSLDNNTESLVMDGTNFSNNGSATSHHFDTGETTWILMCSAVTFLMIPGVGFLYNGMAPRKSSLVLIMTCLWTLALVSIQWYIIGYSLCLSTTGGPIIGNVEHYFLQNVGDAPSPANTEIPALLVGVWYCLFAAITPTIIIGAVCERARFLPSIVFIFIWSTLVFDFLTYWTWNPNGWTYVFGSLDFGGGTPVHISTGAAALAYALILGKRDDNRDKEPHNMAHVVLGTCFIWLGWPLANAGSGLKPNMRAVNVFIATNMAASVGAITWAIMDYFRKGDKKFSAMGFCSGAICGLVAITPASGYVTPSASIAFGILGAVVCNLCMGMKKWIRVDDAFDVFCVHGIGGMVGNVLTGVFASKAVAAVDGTVIEGGAIDGNWAQIGIQFVDTVAGAVWSFVWTLVILFVLDKIPGLSLRPTVEEERAGLDKQELGECMYQFVDDVEESLLTSQGHGQVSRHSNSNRNSKPTAGDRNSMSSQHQNNSSTMMQQSTNNLPLTLITSSHQGKRSSAGDRESVERL